MESKPIDPAWVGPDRSGAMNIYDVLRRCVESARWYSQADKLEAIQLINELETNNVLGTTAAAIHTNGMEEE
jgi:hypothetical protein